MRFKQKFFGNFARMGKVLKEFHIKPVKEIKYQFDPFTDNTKSLRMVMNSLHGKKVIRTSVAKMIIDVRNDRCKPQMDVLFNDGHKVIFKTEHLLASDILEKLDVYCKAKDTSVPEADLALTKMSGKPKKKK